MKKIIFTLLISCLSCTMIAQEDSLLDKYLIKIIPVKFLGLHPNVGLEIPLSTYNHLDIQLGPFFHFIYISGNSDVLVEFFSGTGMNATFGFKRFSRKKDNFYWGPSMTYRYFRSQEHQFNCGECQGPALHGRKIYSSISLEFKTGIQNPKRTTDSYLRIGMRYFVMNGLIQKEVFYVDRDTNITKYYDNKIISEGSITPVITVGFYLSRPLK